MQSHQTLRNLRLWVLAWFVMALGAAAASPLIAPRGLELVCSGTGGTRLVMKAAEGLVAADATGLDCPLCLAADAPPATPPAATTTTAAPTFQPRFHTSLSARTGMALSPPARAPPLFN
ncbi:MULTISPECIES: hypothetical protein [unclassified Acidovorax]|uniref:hypothetical protein n=1 Tax=unclassified Acidovorax TaxID=2684926 RepID=UPI0006FF10F5|nr:MULTISPECIES: hypothetical protein [unclassified Acidovorax]KRB42133.1 hypothetical protein ASD94_00050 [Acidovorax sp. Root70]PUA95675.1 hypothetical protein C8C99_0476 [Acidovorax sp. 107]